MQTVQAATAIVAHPAQPAGPDHPRHPQQDRGQDALEEAFALPLSRSPQIRSQQQRQRGIPFHAPEVQCIGKASAPYDFGVNSG